MKSRAICFEQAHQVTVVEDQIDAGYLPPGHILIRSEASIISSGTELARLHASDHSGVDSFPAWPGYGCIARVEAVADGVDDVAVGDRIFCAGRHRSVQIVEHGTDHQWSHVFPVPDDIDPVDACLACMAQIAITAVHVSDIRLHDRVAVFGLGLVGNLAAQLFQLAGADVIGLDPVSHRCEQARNCGLDTCLDAAPDAQLQALHKHWGDSGAAISVDAAGHSAVVAQCIQATRKLGQVVLLGTPRAACECNITDHFNTIHTQGLTVRGAHMWHFPLLDDPHIGHSVQNNFAVIFDLIRTGKLKVRELISHVIKPDEAPAAYTGLSEQPDIYTSVVIDWR